jgi:hypothetical protein
MPQSTLDLSTKQSGPVECLGQTFPNDQARREHYLKLLAERLKDPEFRKIEGFPIGKAEDILALSDPPYYTACPNPWLGAFIKAYGTPYDPKKPYHREPFAADVSEGKNHPIYLAHSYHTKVPHRAIMRYILHYTQPGELVFDGFCGTGMTGVAAQFCGDRNEVQALGYRVQADGTLLNEEGKPFSKLGIRRAVLNDLAPAATFIAYNYNSPTSAEGFEPTSTLALQQAEKECGWMFKTVLSATEDELKLAAKAIVQCRTAEECRALLENNNALKFAINRKNSSLRLENLNYVVWSDVFACPECGSEIVFWNRAIDTDDWQVKKSFTCEHCAAVLNKDQLTPVKVTAFDRALNTTLAQTKSVPVLLHYKTGTKKPDAFDLALYQKTSEVSVSNWFPTNRMTEGGEGRRNDPFGLTHVHHFYSSRNLQFLACFAEHIGPTRKQVNVTSVATVGTKMYRFRSQNGSLGAGGGPLSGTLYVPSLCKEIPLPKMIREHIKKTADVKRSLLQTPMNLTQTGSSTSLASVPTESMDYLFVDPPFGGNLNYAELNHIWESWLKVATARAQEAITDKSQEKGLDEYQKLLHHCFSEFFRILKPGRWMTVEFSNSLASVWNTIQTTLQEAGFVVANVAALDKKQGSFKAVTTTTAVKQDLVISAYKPNGGLEERFAKRGVTEEGVWDFIQTHLRNLPVVKSKGGQLEMIAERDPRILYDRMVAFYVGHSTQVPLNSPEFQSILADKFPERDGMYFLPEQVNEYDKKRAQVESVGQLSIFVEDERSAINWLRSFLKERPSTTQDIQPEFMQQLGASWKKWEARPELKVLLDQNFLCYDGTGEVPSQIHSYLSTQYKTLRNLPKNDKLLQNEGKNRWYVPDPKKNIDVETLRNKRLLEEFWTYLPPGYVPAALLSNKAQTLPGMEAPRPKVPKGKKLKELRTEAVRVGFKHCYQQKDYTTILVVAEMIPDTVLNEDEQLQMIYDTAVTRSGVGE